MNRPDLRSPRAIAQERRADLRFALVTWAWALIVSVCVAFAVAPGIIAKAQHDAARSLEWQEMHR